jgi:hypothetical protein
MNNSVSELQASYLELLKRKVKVDLPELMQTVLDYPNLEKFHTEIGSTIIRTETEGKRALFLLPRGHLKSTMITVSYPIQRILRDPNVRILITNALLDNSKGFLREIKGHFERNEKLKALFGDYSNKDEKWSEMQVIVKKRTSFHKEPTIQVTSVDKSVVSQHYDLIIADDLQNRENSSTKEQRDKVEKYYKDLLDLLEPGGELLIIGTRWHDDDIYGRLIRKGEINVMVRKAIENGKAIFPSKFPLEYLEKLKKEKGSFEFSSQYMNDPVPDEDAEFKGIRTYTPIGEVHGAIFITVDPALSKDENADKTGIVVNEVHEGGKWRIREAYGARLNPTELVDQILYLCKKYEKNLVCLGIEDIMYTQAIDFELQRRMQEQKCFYNIEKVRHRGRKKDNRIRALIPLFERGNIEIAEQCGELLDQIVRFPASEHDDILDALAYQLDLVDPIAVFHNNKQQNHNEKHDDNLFLSPIFPRY